VFILVCDNAPRLQRLEAQHDALARQCEINGCANALPRNARIKYARRALFGNAADRTIRHRDLDKYYERGSP